MNSELDGLSCESLQSDRFDIPDLLSKEMGAAVLEYTDDHRNRVYTPEKTVLGMIYQVLNRGSQSSAVDYLNSQRVAAGLEPVSSNTSSYSDARKRLPVDVLKSLTSKVATKTQDHIKKEFSWHGLTVKAIDGSTFTMDDTPENQKLFPQHSNQEEGIGFPLARAVILQNLATGMIEGANYASFKGKGTGEMSLAQPLIDQLKQGDLLLGDRYYPSFFMIAKLMEKKVHGVFQIQGARDYDFREGQKLGALDHIVTWTKPASQPCWMSDEEFESFPNEISVRQVDVTEQAKTGDRMVLVTTLLDEAIFTKKELSKLYKSRWAIESALKCLKADFCLDHIHAKSPDMVEKVVWSHLLAFNQIKWYMLNISRMIKCSVQTISFNATISILIQNTLNIMNASTDAEQRRVRASIIIQIVKRKVPYRPGRTEPRAVKKRRKPHPLLKKKRSLYHPSSTP